MVFSSCWFIVTSPQAVPAAPKTHCPTSPQQTAKAYKAMEHNIFTVGNYFYNGVGHVTVKYEEVLAIGYEGIIAKAQAELDKCNVGDGDYARRSRFLQAVIMSCEAVMGYAYRYAVLADEMAAACENPVRKAELETITAKLKKD